MPSANVELRGDEASRSVCAGILAASQEDWGTEYLDYILSIKTVKNIEEAIAHINQYISTVFFRHFTKNSYCSSFQSSV